MYNIAIEKDPSHANSYLNKGNSHLSCRICSRRIKLIKRGNKDV